MKVEMHYTAGLLYLGCMTALQSLKLSTWGSSILEIEPPRFDSSIFKHEHRAIISKLEHLWCEHSLAHILVNKYAYSISEIMSLTHQLKLN